MKCRKCRTEIPADSKFCNACGAKQGTTRAPKRNGNGQGSVYQLPNKTWKAVKTIGWEHVEGKPSRRITRSKSGFKTKKEAVQYLPLLTGGPMPRRRSITFKKLYDAWEPTHRAGKSTMDCYKAAVKHFQPVWYSEIQDITVDDLQECIDECSKGKRTRENMKALCGLIYKYAIPRNLATLNMGQYLIVGGGDTCIKDALPDEAVHIIEKNVGKVNGADYVLCQCYLGFRPSEFLALDAANYDRKEKAFVGGAKTEAGRNRTVPVAKKIQKIVDNLTANKISGPVFCGENNRPMDIKTYRALFYEVLDTCGIDNPVEEIAGVKRRKYTPHSCRHTFATMMKRVKGADKDKLELMGHTSTEMLRHYQDVSIEDLRTIVDSL